MFLFEAAGGALGDSPGGGEWLWLFLSICPVKGFVDVEVELRLLIRLRINHCDRVVPVPLLHHQRLVDRP